MNWVECEDFLRRNGFKRQQIQFAIKMLEFIECHPVMYKSIDKGIKIREAEKARLEQLRKIEPDDQEYDSDMTLSTSEVK